MAMNGRLTEQPDHLGELRKSPSLTILTGMILPTDHAEVGSTFGTRRTSSNGSVDDGWCLGPKNFSPRNKDDDFDESAGALLGCPRPVSKWLVNGF